MSFKIIKATNINNIRGDKNKTMDEDQLDKYIKENDKLLKDANKSSGKLTSVLFQLFKFFEDFINKEGMGEVEGKRERERDLERGMER